MTIGALLQGYATEKQRQHQQDYDNEMSERQLRLSVLMKAADNPDITVDERRHILNEAGTMMGTPAVKGLFGRERKKASQPLALGDLLMPPGQSNNTNIVPDETPGATQVVPKSDTPVEVFPAHDVIPGQPQYGNVGAVTLEPPPSMSTIHYGDRRIGDIQQDRELRRVRTEYQLKEENDAASDERRHRQAVDVARINAQNRTETTRLKVEAAEHKDRNKLITTFLGEMGGDPNDPVAVAQATQMADKYQADFARTRLGEGQSRIELNKSRSNLNKVLADSTPQRLEIMREGNRIGWARVQILDQANQLKVIELRTPDFKIAEARAQRDTNATWTPTWTETKTRDYVEDELQEMRDAGTLSPTLEQAAQSGDPSAVGKVAQLQREARSRAEQRVKLERQRYENDRKADEILKMDEQRKSQGGGGGNGAVSSRGQRQTRSSSTTPQQQRMTSEAEIRAVFKKSSEAQIQELIRKARERGRLQ